MINACGLNWFLSFLPSSPVVKMSKHWFVENEPEIKGLLLRNAVIAVAQPIEYAKVLIQVS